jgi:hypothetical protein
VMVADLQFVDFFLVFRKFMEDVVFFHCF